MARNYFILLISFLGAVALADYAIVTGLVDFQADVEDPQSPDSSVLYKLAQKYEAGVEVELDRDKAIYWYQVAAKNGSEEAKSRLLALKIPLNTGSMDFQGNGKNRSTNNDIDQEAQKITRLLENQLALEKENLEKTKQNKTQIKTQIKTQEMQDHLAEDKKAAKLKDDPKSGNITDRDEEVATFERPSNKNFSSNNNDDVSNTTNSKTKKAIPVPLALQPERPLNLPSTQKPSISKSITGPGEQITAFEENPNTENENKEITKNGTVNSNKEETQGEKKEFNVNPCNGPAAKFMSTCR